MSMCRTIHPPLTVSPSTRTPAATSPDRARRQPSTTRPGRPAKSRAVIDALGFKIVSGKLVPGDLLPTEAELARSLGLSRPSLREGLKALAQKGLLEGRTRRGTVVRERANWDLLDADVLRWLAAAPPDPAFFMDLLDVRMIVEPAAARLAASRASSSVDRNEATRSCGSCLMKPTVSESRIFGWVSGTITRVVVSRVAKS